MTPAAFSADVVMAGAKAPVKGAGEKRRRREPFLHAPCGNASVTKAWACDKGTLLMSHLHICSEASLVRM